MVRTYRVHYSSRGRSVSSRPSPSPPTRPPPVASSTAPVPSLSVPVPAASSQTVVLFRRDTAQLARTIMLYRKQNISPRHDGALRTTSHLKTISRISTSSKSSRGRVYLLGPADWNAPTGRPQAAARHRELTGRHPAAPRRPPSTRQRPRPSRR